MIYLIFPNSHSVNDKGTNLVHYGLLEYIEINFSQMNLLCIEYYIPLSPLSHL